MAGCGNELSVTGEKSERHLMDRMRMALNVIDKAGNVARGRDGETDCDKCNVAVSIDTEQ